MTIMAFGKFNCGLRDATFINPTIKSFTDTIKHMMRYPSKVKVLSFMLTDNNQLAVDVLVNVLDTDYYHGKSYTTTIFLDYIGDE